MVTTDEKASFRSQLRCGAVSTIVGGVLIYMTVGTIYSFGNMSPYIVSYMRVREVDPNLTYETASFILGLGKFMQGFGIWVGGHFESRIGMRWTTITGIVLFSMSFVISYWAIQISFIFLLFSYGVLFGFGFGVAYIPPMICVLRWLPNSKGAASGILLAGIGAGTLIFNFVQTGFINPNNLAPDIRVDDGVSEDVYYSQDAVLDRVPLSFLLQGGLFFLIMLIGLCLLRVPPESPERKRIDGETTQLLTTSLSEEKYGCSRDTGEYGSIIGERDSEKGSKHWEEIRAGNRLQTSSENGIVSATARRNEIAEPYHQESLDEDYDGTRHFDVDAAAKRIGHDDSSREKSRSSSSAADDDQRDDERGSSSSPVAQGDEDARWSGQTVRGLQIFKRVFYWQLSLTVFLDGIALLLVTALYKAYGQTFIPDDFFLAAVGSISAVMNSGGRIFWGSCADRFSIKMSFMLVSGVMAVFTLTMPLTPYGGKAMFLIWVCLVFFSIGGLFSTAPTATSRAFGSTDFGKNYGLVFFVGISLSSLVGSFIQTALSGHLSWDALFVSIGSLPVIGIILSMTMNVKSREGKDI